MSANYYDLDDILSEAETLPCTWKDTAYDLGYLDERNDEEDV